MELRMGVVFFLIVVSSSAAEKVKKYLTGTEGGNITLPDPVLEFGFLLFGGKNIAMVKGIDFDIIDESYRHRVLWNQNTGLFTLTGLQRNDTGEYIIDNKGGVSFICQYELTVHATVPTPAVNRLSVSADSCTLLCFVDPEEETTLLWYRHEEIVNQSSHAVSLPLTVHKENYNSTYKCAAANPVEEKDVPVDVQSFCSEQNHTVSNRRHYRIAITITIVSIVIVILAFFIIKKTFLDKVKTTTQAPDSVNIEQEVQYTEIQIHAAQPSQEGSLPDSPAAVDCSRLTSVYDKIEPYRMVPRPAAATEEL
ncbi:uncharacterized protein LOC118312399 [Scophthalmus maximus]|uniref:uncharacterized protein LOC118312399 n=1 Tax=Scophthalmus maximus TaxID=52904 RepID=UPI0015E14740|nr:uncharacterized protein LOC118312399 [Scophthalmus maximus]